LETRSSPAAGSLAFAPPPRHLFEEIVEAVGAEVRGRREVVHRAAITLCAGGHLLIEDVPGVGKTTLARALAAAIGGTFHRVQFTSDLLPADILGVNILDAAAGGFRFRPGPIFSHVLLADEVNRTTPRTQSALLQAMEEHLVTLDGVTHALPDPFFVIATQNPLDHHGTYPLPDSQMDRFMMRLSMGYPERDAEIEMLEPGGGRAHESGPVAAVTPGALLRVRRGCETTRMDRSLKDYLMRLVEATRRHPDLALGASPRAAISLGRAARAAAFAEGRDYVIPDDIKDLAEPVLAHRLVAREGTEDPASRLARARGILAEILERTPVPL
jgi:MoxR-like ATPase